MTINYLVTHSGGFHADELLSSAVLTRAISIIGEVALRVSLMRGPQVGTCA